MNQKHSILFRGLALSMALSFSVSAQEEDIPLLTPEEASAVQSQTAEIYQSLGPLVRKAASSVVSVGSASPNQSCFAR